jgi:hypothetical protein
MTHPELDISAFDEVYERLTHVRQLKFIDRTVRILQYTCSKKLHFKKIVILR